jgi:hypothetical protein
MTEKEIFKVFATFDDAEKDLIPAMFPAVKMPRVEGMDEHRQLIAGLTKLAQEWRNGPKVPKIHRNGSDGKHLAAKLRAASDALHDAIEAMRETAPNARDYYTNGPNAFKFAAKEHHERIAKVEMVKDDLGKIWENILDQLDIKP